MTEQKSYASILTSDSLTIYVDGRARVVHRDSKNFDKILDAYKIKDFETAIKIMDLATQKVEAFGQGKISVVDGVIIYNGSPIHNVLTDKILTMIDEGFDVNPMVKFLENLLDNPSHRAVQELYLFLEHGKLPITEDGHFLAYKKVRKNFFDVHSNTFDNTPGNILEMPRNEVDDNRDQVCSKGLHFCSLPYLKSFGGERVVILKINPKDVVSIPSDYNNTKGRTCRYEVLEEYSGPLDEEAFDKSVWSDNEEEIDEEDSWEDDSWGFGEDSWDETPEDENVDQTDDNIDGVELDGGSFITPVKEKKQVMDHLLGQVRETEFGTKYTIVSTQRERNSKGHFTGDVKLTVDFGGSGFSEIPLSIAKDHKIIEQVNHPGANEKPDHPDVSKLSTTTTRAGQHIDPAVISGAELARQSLLEDLGSLYNAIKKIE